MNEQEDLYDLVRIMARSVSRLGYIVEITVNYPDDCVSYTYRDIPPYDLTRAGRPAIIKLSLTGDSASGSYFAGGRL